MACLPAVKPNRFQREKMLRLARLATNCETASGIFDLIGLQYARRAARTWRPRGLLLMEDLSLAFEMVEHQRNRGILVEDDDVERLVELLYAFFPFVGA